VALRAAQEQAHAALATDYLTLATERAAVQQAEHDRLAAINELEEALSQARSAETAADQRLADLQLLCDHQKAQLADLAAQRDALITAGQRSDAELAAQVALMQSRDAAATAERLRHVEHLRAAEDRAHAEVDRARQEAQALRKLLDAASRLQLTRDAEQRALETTLRQSISDAQRDAAVAKARADTFAARLPTQAKRTAKGGRPGKDVARATKRAPRAKPTSSR
jgi:chromosome segregation ATPase